MIIYYEDDTSYDIRFRYSPQLTFFAHFNDIIVLFSACNIAGDEERSLGGRDGVAGQRLDSADEDFAGGGSVERYYVAFVGHRKACASMAEEAIAPLLDELMKEIDRL